MCYDVFVDLAKDGVLPASLPMRLPAELITAAEKCEMAYFGMTGFGHGVAEARYYYQGEIDQGRAFAAMVKALGYNVVGFLAENLQVADFDSRAG
jgi:hypothetical protein